MRKASLPHRMGQITAAIIAALVLSVFTFSGPAAAWSTPTLTGACAPDASHYGWTINLPHEADYKIDMAFSSAFTGAMMTDFGSQGAHSFTTARTGAKLYVRWTSDHNVATSATANATLCGTGSTGGTVAGSQQNNGTSDKESPKGNNGDVKIHATGTSVTDKRNEPHVCSFYIDAFKFDKASSGTWSIEGWAPTKSGVVASGSWGPADSEGNWHSANMTLADGHYKLFFKQTGTTGGEKQKVFWVDCGKNTNGDVDTEKVKTDNDNDNGGTTAGTQCSGTATMASHSDIEGATQGGTATVTFTMTNGCSGKELSLVSYTAPSAEFSRESASEQTLFESKTGTFTNGVFVLKVNVPSCFFQVDFVMGKPITQLGPASSNNFYSDQGRLIAGVNGGTTSCKESTSAGGGSTVVTPTETKTGDSEESAQPGDTDTSATPGNGNAVAGFQTPPSNTAVGAVTPVVELPGGSNQLPPNNVQGVQTAPVAGVQALPSTSTDSAPTIPLAALGLGIIGLGGALLRRRDPRI